MASSAWSLTGNNGTNPSKDFLGTTDRQPLVLKTGDAERLRVDINGNVGVGTSAPSSTLHVSAPGSANPFGALTVDVQSFDTEANAQASYFLRVRDIGAAPPDGLTYLLIRGDGNVGVGTTTPASRLTINGDLSVNVPGSTNAIGALSVDVQSFETADNAQASYFLRVRDVGAGPPDGLTHFFIRGDGNVGLGTTTPTSRLTVDGDVSVSGDVLLTGADCAEQFDVTGKIPEPGTIVVIDHEGAICECSEPYDRRVAGVVSGAGDYNHAIVLDRRPSQRGRVPIALVGKVYCKVDARYSPVRIGDLLTTSSTPGHAMKATLPEKAFAATIGKALRPLASGTGLIPILIALQ